MCRKVLLKAFQGSTGPITQLLGSLFSTAAVADSLHAACCMQHGQNQWWDNITLSLHNNLGNLLPSTVRSWRQGYPPSPPQGDILTLSFIHQLLCTNIYQHVSQHPQPHHTILDIQGIRGSSLLGTGSKFFFSTVEEPCETNPLLQSTVIQIFEHSPFNQISNPEYSST
jgi:hypothetical protein